MTHSTAVTPRAGTRCSELELAQGRRVLVLDVLMADHGARMEAISILLATLRITPEGAPQHAVFKAESWAVLSDSGEAPVLQCLGRELERTPDPIVVTFGGASFLPVLKLRALIHDVSLPGLYGIADAVPAPVPSEAFAGRHVDLADHFGGQARSPSLEAIAAALGCPMLSESAENSRSGASLRRVCVCYALLLRLEAHAGRIASARMREIFDDFADALAVEAMEDPQLDELLRAMTARGGSHASRSSLSR